MSNFIVRKAAVLGAGVMGAQIAAHLANAEVPVVLFDLPAKEGDPSGMVGKAIDALRKLEPSPLASKDRVAYIDAANYSQHLDQLQAVSYTHLDVYKRQALGWIGKSLLTLGATATH